MAVADRESITTALERDLREARRIINDLVRRNKAMEAVIASMSDPDEMGVTTSDDGGVW